ncbi:MAG: hypothetical protein HQL11_01945 [Candidatus Omnitrophica bacterium]|nr:hypothetical protein [Candidatus Omnitrophota bacterium]
MRSRSIFHKPQAVCEFGSSRVRIAHIVYDRKKRQIRVLGLGEAEAAGMKNGRLMRPQDAAESIRAAAVAAGKESALEIGDLVVSLPDPDLESVKLNGTCFLEHSAEGFEVRHLRESARRAYESLGPVDRQTVYRKEAGFLVDRTDYLEDPVGICGKELKAVVHCLFSESAQAQGMIRTVRRAGFKVRGLHPAIAAALYGIAPIPGEAATAVLIHADTELCHISKIEHGSLQNWRGMTVLGGYDARERESLAVLARKAGAGARTAVRLTGPRAVDPDWVRAVETELTDVEVTVATAHPDTGFEGAASTVLAGLYYAQMETRRESMPMKLCRGVTDCFARKARSFVEEYF